MSALQAQVNVFRSTHDLSFMFAPILDETFLAILSVCLSHDKNSLIQTPSAFVSSTLLIGTSPTDTFGTDILLTLCRDKISRYPVLIRFNDVLFDVGHHLTLARSNLMAVSNSGIDLPHGLSVVRVSNLTNIMFTEMYSNTFFIRSSA